MIKSRLKSEIECLKADNASLKARCAAYESQETKLEISQQELSRLHHKVQDMKTALVKYENMLNLINDWDKMTYIVTDVTCNYKSYPIHMSIDLDVVPASIHEDAKQTKGEQR